MAASKSLPQGVIAISSHVVRGAVGNRASVFALERLGHAVWDLPTVVLAWHPGHGPATRSATHGFAAMVDDLIGSPWLGEIGAVTSGYLGAPEQAEAIARLVEAVRTHRPDAHYLCDPVIGDAGGLYVPQDTAAAIRDHLLPLASIATPNRHELAWLAGAPLDDNAAIIDAALALGPKRVVVTSAFAALKGATGNLLLSGAHALLAEHRVVANAPKGLGDLFSALFLARLLQGADDEHTLQAATAGVFDVLARTVRRGADELTLSADAGSLINPLALVTMRRLAHPLNRQSR